MAQSKVSVCGAAITAFNRRTDGSSFRDWASEAFDDALLMSSLVRQDIDALIVATESDFFTLQLNPASVLASDLGLIGVSTLRVEGGGASGQLAVQTASRLIQSGTHRHVAVVGVDPSASQLSAATVKSLYSFSFDAWTDGITGVSATALYALSFQSFMNRIAVNSDHLGQVTRQNRANAVHNPRAHLGKIHSQQDIDESPMLATPYRRLHCSPLSDGAAALILSSAKHLPVARKTAATIVGMGSASDTLHLGARSDPGHFAAKRIAMQRACADANIEPKDIDIAEVYDAYAGAQLQAIDALGLSNDIPTDLASLRFCKDGGCPINLSGGLMGQGAPVGATGVAQVATCALILEGLYEAHLQPSLLPRFALADTHGGICTTAAVTLLEGPVA